MKKKFFSIIAVVALVVIAAFNMNLSRNKDAKSLLTLANVEALAQENSNEKIYRYDTVFGEECWIYVGEAYAKGSKINCWPGNEHPICVTCKL